MKRQMIQAVLLLSLCPLLAAQQPKQAVSLSTTTPAGQQAPEAPSSSAIAARTKAIKNARTIRINSETRFLTVSTLERALMKEKNWNQLGLNIVETGRSADLEIVVNRLIFTHIHTYVVTDKSTGIVLAAGRVRAFDGIVASGPMAEQIVKILSSARLPAQPAGPDRGL
ncbi:MAG: hypothetical protein P4K93_16760 [Terracidiphilus sp.]|nr:hypothetical protein [Terracidiphilus sp.]MDR3799803.1 hypothetical protein [Terracidiphilus sp.]